MGVPLFRGTQKNPDAPRELRVSQRMFLPSKSQNTRNLLGVSLAIFMAQKVITKLFRARLMYCSSRVSNTDLGVYAIVFGNTLFMLLKSHNSRNLRWGVGEHVGTKSYFKMSSLEADSLQLTGEKYRSGGASD